MKFHTFQTVASASLFEAFPIESPFRLKQLQMDLNDFLDVYSSIDWRVTTAVHRSISLSFFPCPQLSVLLLFTTVASWTNNIYFSSSLFSFLRPKTFFFYLQGVCYLSKRSAGRHRSSTLPSTSTPITNSYLLFFLVGSSYFCWGQLIWSDHW